MRKKFHLCSQHSATLLLRFRPLLLPPPSALWIREPLAVCNSTASSHVNSTYSGTLTSFYVLNADDLPGTKDIVSPVGQMLPGTYLRRRWRLCQLLSKVTFASCSFHMFNVRLAAGRRTLKCVITEVVLFSVIASKTLIFDTVVWRHTWGAVGSLVIVLLHIFSWFWQWKKVWT